MACCMEMLNITMENRFNNGEQFYKSPLQVKQKGHLTITEEDGSVKPHQHISNYYTLNRHALSSETKYFAKKKNPNKKVPNQT